MLPYVRQGEIDYAALDYNPDDPEPMPDAMEQEFVVQEILGIMHSRFTDFKTRPDVFLSSNTILCYDPTNLNVRRQPDIYLAFGVDQGAIRRRRIYLPWEAGKPPDLALEVGSESTGAEDTRVKTGRVRVHRDPRVLAVRPQRRRAPRGASVGRDAAGRGSISRSN